MKAKAPKDHNGPANAETAPNEDTDKLYISRPRGWFRSNVDLPLMLSELLWKALCCVFLAGFCDGYAEKSRSLGCASGIWWLW